METTQQITITRNTVCGGKDVFVGQTVSASAQDARILFATGKAVPAGKQSRKSGGKEDSQA